MSATEDEFATVDLILGSEAETRAVDAFTLSLIKAERQARRLFTHLVYQFPAWGARYNSAIRYTASSDVPTLAVVISEDGQVDLIPRLRPQIRRSQVAKLIALGKEAHQAQDWKKVRQAVALLDTELFGDAAAGD